MTSRSGRLNVGMLAALGASLALHIGLAAILFARLPHTPDARPDFALSVSIASSEIETSGAVPLSSVRAAPPIELAHPVAAVAPVADAQPLAIEAAADITSASPGLAPALREAAPSTRIIATPSALPAVPAIEATASKGDEPGAPLVGAVLPAPVANAAPTAILLSRPPQASDPAPAPHVGTTHAPAAMPVAPVDVDTAKPLTARETMATPAAIVAVAAAAVVPAANPRATAARIQEDAIGLSHLPMEAASIAPYGSSAEVTGIVTAAVPPSQETIPAAAQPEPPMSIAPSPSSSKPQRVAQAAHLHDSTLEAHDETEVDRVRMIQSFIDRYDGGSCFLMAPAARVTPAFDIEGFATDRYKIHRFDEGFKEETGREARVVGQWISPKQCGAVDFLQAAKHAAKGLTIEIERRDVPNGDVLAGTVGGAGPEPIRLYWISESGAVNDISERVQDRGERKTFAVPVRRAIVGGPYPQLLVAIVGDDWPVPAGETLRADAFFASIRADALKTHRSISAGGRPFRLIP